MKKRRLKKKTPKKGVPVWKIMGKVFNYHFGLPIDQFKPTKKLIEDLKIHFPSQKDKAAMLQECMNKKFSYEEAQEWIEALKSDREGAALFIQESLSIYHASCSCGKKFSSN